VPFFDDLVEPDDLEDIAARNAVHVTRPSWSAWLPPRPHVCQRCSTTTLTREPAPRCARCGAWEDE
jgi:hypothetical protein